MKITHTKKSVTASTSTRDRISYLEEQIAVLEDKIKNGDYVDPEEMIDDKLALDELRDELNFAWQDDEAEYNYALQQQEFNPDGSLKGYDDYYDDTYSSTKVTASSEWAASWDKRSFADGDSAPYYVMSVPTGTARVLPNDVEGSKYHAEIKFRNGSNLRSVALDSYLDAMDWAENLLFNNGNHVESSTCIEAAELVDNDKIQVGLQYNNDGHRFEVKSISKDGKKCKVTEEWISEDTGKEVKKTYTYVIESDADGREYMYDPNYADYKDEWWCKKYAQGADNYPWDFAKHGLDIPEEVDTLDFEDVEEDEEDEEYTPSATRGDYSPSNPWDAPGMNIHDFI